MRRRRVVTGEADRVERAERSGLDQPARLAIAGVEATLEAELERDAAAVDLVGDGERVVEVGRQRLLAERRQAAPDRGTDEVGMGVGGGGDDDGLGGVHGGLDGRGGRGAHLGRDLGGTRRVGIGDDDAVDAGRGRQQPAVETPDPARSEQRDPSSSLLVPAARAATEPSQRRGQDPPPDRRALRRRTPAAVLLDHQPAVVVAVGRGGEDPVEVEHARPELGEEARPDRRIEAADRPAAQAVEDHRGRRP